MRRSLITGGAGFIGSHLAEHLLALGEEVVVLDNLTTGRFDNIRHLVGRRGFRHFIGNVEDTALLAQAAEGCQAIYHLAAAVGVNLILNDPVLTIETNINGSDAVLRYAVRYGKRVLIASTSEVYGKGAKIPFAEDDDVVYGPTSRLRWSYAVSKAVDEFLLRAYVESKGLPGVIARLFNTVGPRQVGHYGMVVPRFVEQAIKGEPITVFGDGSQTRCFGHVLDVVPALHRLLWRDDLAGEVVNLGSDQRISIMDLAKKVRDRVGASVEIRTIPYEIAYRQGFEDMQDRVPDLTRASKLIGYRPTRGIDAILDDAIAFARGEWKPDVAAARVSRV